MFIIIYNIHIYFKFSYVHSSPLNFFEKLIISLIYITKPKMNTYNSIHD